ncbi:MAG TPA: hypothetical protein VLK65_05835 [Vicinamibacteria bacterium]|nr:hypothetical protein [Vicinamibacteria bacterium]
MDQPDMHDGENILALRGIVEQRQVCFDAFRERVGFQALGPRAIGYELVLSGIHARGSHPPMPGCELCRDVYDDLTAIAEWILPTEHRPSSYQFEPYRPIIRATRKRRLRHEVTLSIRILHRDHYEEPIDKCETRCLVEMKDRLKQIGACDGEWKR